LNEDVREEEESLGRKYTRASSDGSVGRRQSRIIVWSAGEASPDLSRGCSEGGGGKGGEKVGKESGSSARVEEEHSKEQREKEREREREIERKKERKRIQVLRGCPTRPTSRGWTLALSRTRLPR